MLKGVTTPAKTGRRAIAGPITITQMPMITCERCGDPLPAPLGTASAVLTEHYNARHLSELTAAALSH